MDAEVYPDPRVSSFIAKNFVPVKIHIKEQPDVFERLGAQWTPTILVLDPQGVERHRFEGYLPADDFLPELQLGLGHAALANKQWAEAERRFHEVAERHPGTEMAAQALYWEGVARYKASGQPAPLAEAARQLAERFPESSWAKKASVWAH